ncbi:hypothetical protein Fcan01_16882, partial [Folsomia candida]
CSVSLGLDANALTKEYFSLGYMSILTRCYRGFPLFDGRDDGKVPSRANGGFNVYVNLGSFLVHSFMHTGVAMYGLHKSIVKYLCTLNYDWEAEDDTISVADIVSCDAMEILTRLEEFMDTPARFNKVITSVKEIREMPASSKKDPQSLKNALAKFDLINSRRVELELIKRVFIASGVTKFLNDRRHLCSNAFPRLDEIRYTADLVVRKISFQRGENDISMDTELRIRQVFFKFLFSIEGK